jgi:hypothetical protein
MRSMFIVSVSAVNKHVGEEYDTIIEVPYEPTTENIQACADKVMAGIKDLWAQEVGESEPDKVSMNPKVVIHLDAATPFGVMLENLQIILKAQSGIIIELPWVKPPDVEELDAESREILHKLENRQ